MGKLWTFGDSFTDGCGCRPNDEFYEKYPDIRGKIWPQLLADNLNLELVNYGIPSASNFVIHYTFTMLIGCFSKGDTVVVGLSDPTRLGFYTDYAPDPKSFSVNSTLQKYNESPFNKVMGKQEFEALQDYSKYSHVAYEKKWHTHYIELFSKLLRLLESNGIRTNLWTFEEWDRHSRINHFTKGKVHDQHWSWDGHKSFYNKIRHEIKPRGPI